jgi:hypothetical protein
MLGIRATGESLEVTAGSVGASAPEGA